MRSRNYWSSKVLGEVIWNFVIRLVFCPAQVYKNVYEHQLTEYAKSQGKTLGDMSDADRDDIEQDMLGANYPGGGRIQC